MKKDITFIYSDNAEKSLYKPLYKEAKKRGYNARLTSNPFARCEIGVYCQHINFPQYSKFSVIMLHDIIQQYGNWPDIWFREPWHKYDIGILPSEEWVNNWNKVSQNYYTCPRVGMFKVGWPKADDVARIQNSTYRDEFYKKYNMDINKKTILYAPAWENDNKQDDFVKAMQLLDVNILIKQGPFPEDKFPEIVKNIKEMEKLHTGVPNVTILDPKTNIFEVIAVSDILVSEESSTMCEAILMGIPAISVSDWLIPDCTPSRFPECSYSFVTMTKIAELTTCVKNMLSDYSKYKAKAEDYSKKNFSNIGNSSKMIMDLIDDCVEGKTIRYEKLKPNRRKKLSLKKYLRFTWISVKREIYYNYRTKSKLLDLLWRLLRKIKNSIVH